MKLKVSLLLPLVAIFVVAGVVYASDAEAPRTAEDQRTESVTLLVRGMMKSRSGAT